MRSGRRFPDTQIPDFGGPGIRHPDPELIQKFGGCLKSIFPEIDLLWKFLCQRQSAYAGGGLPEKISR
jgi:hypothetical protein